MQDNKHMINQLVQHLQLRFFHQNDSLALEQLALEYMDFQNLNRVLQQIF